MLADLISEATKEGLESARARGRAGGRKPKLTARPAQVARGMYEEKGDEGKRRYTVAEIAGTFACPAKPSTGTWNHPVAAASPTRPPGGPCPAGRRARCRARPAPTSPPPVCGHEPATRDQALRQREDLAIVWLHLDGDRVTEARHCVACQPHEHIIDVSCSGCGDGPLITGRPPEPRRPAPSAGAGVAVRPPLATPSPAAMPRRPQIAASVKPPRRSGSCTNPRHRPTSGTAARCSLVPSGSSYKLVTCQLETQRPCMFPSLPCLARCPLPLPRAVRAWQGRRARPGPGVEFTICPCPALGTIRAPSAGPAAARSAAPGWPPRPGVPGL
jgi:hypothetical protein